jgi:hypothetical protein
MASMRRGEIGISAGMAILAAGFYGLATFTQDINPVDPGPAAYPRAVSFLLFVCAAAQVLLSWRRKAPANEHTAEAVGTTAKTAYLYSLGTLALSVLYVGLFDKASYLVTTTGFLLALMLLGGVRRWLVLLGVAVLYSLSTYYVFGKILMVQLP